MDGSPPVRPTIAARPASPRLRPDPGAMRLAGGFVGLATASAIVSAMLAPAPIDSAAGTTAILAPAPVPEVIHIKQYVKLKPGQTAPPQAVVQQPVAPAPRVVRVVTKQSGVKP